MVSARPARPETGSEPAFSEVLSSKRGGRDDVPAGEVAAPQATSEPAAGGDGPRPEPASPPGEGQRTDASPADASAQAERDDAQILPQPAVDSSTSPAAPSRPDLVIGPPAGVPVQNAGSAAQNDVPVLSSAGTAPQSSVAAVTTPASAATQPQSGRPAPEQQPAGTGPATGPAQSAAASQAAPVSVSGQLQSQLQGQLQDNADQPQPGQPQVTPGPVRVAGPGQPQPGAQTDAQTGTGTQSDGGSTDGAGHRPDAASPAQQQPAVGRAMQVQAAVTLENIAGQSPPPALTASGLTPAGGQPPVAGVPAEEAPTSERVIRGLTAMLQQRGGSMTMRLDPPALGQLRVQMTLVRGVVTAEFQPATAEAQALLDRSIATLRSALESQGLSVERLTVHAAPGTTPARETPDQQPQQHQQQSARHQSDAGQGRSRGRGDDTPRHDAPARRFTANFDNHLERTGAAA